MISERSSLLWLVGACPSRVGDEALRATGNSGSSADRLRVMLEMDVEEFNQAFRRVNVLSDPPWNKVRARVAGRALRRQIAGAEALVLGRDAWLALGLPDHCFFFESHKNFTLLPHPSGRSLVYNSGSSRAVLRRVVMNALSGFD
jgi:hypothetical protein